MLDDQKLKFFQKCFDCRCGTLWWGKEEFIQERFENWCPSNSLCHPLLSTQQGPIIGVFSAVPMLVGTSVKPNGRKIKLPIQLKKLTDFGTKPRSTCIFVEDFLGDDKATPKQICANKNKPRITPSEYELLKEFLGRQKNATYKGYVS